LQDNGLEGGNLSCAGIDDGAIGADTDARNSDRLGSEILAVNVQRTAVFD
jgi:hypothetical protein